VFSVKNVKNKLKKKDRLYSSPDLTLLGIFVQCYSMQEQLCII